MKEKPHMCIPIKETEITTQFYWTHSSSSFAEKHGLISKAFLCWNLPYPVLNLLNHLKPGAQILEENREMHFHSVFPLCGCEWHSQSLHWPVWFWQHLFLGSEVSCMTSSIIKFNSLLLKRIYIIFLLQLMQKAPAHSYLFLSFLCFSHYRAAPKFQCKHGQEHLISKYVYIYYSSDNPHYSCGMLYLKQLFFTPPSFCKVITKNKKI